MAAHADEVERALGRALTRLYERVPLGMRLGLGPMKEACVRAGHPERSFPCVHVAGTNGKGSVSALIEGAARAAGKKTGLYTSPHLARFAERIRIDGVPVDDATLANVLEEALDVGHDLSFFETATLAAFFAFRAAGVTLAVLEVGLGGRFDATNVIEAPLCSVVTRIAFDHEDRLGNTLAQIASEKAGIAKSDTPMIVGRLNEEARTSLVRIATVAGAKLRFVDEEPRIELDARALPSPAGEYQRKNVEVALLACRVLGLESYAKAGFSGVVWPGRFEWLDTAGGPFLLDAAHNPDGAEGLVASIDAALSERPAAWPEGASLEGRPRALVFGSLADKSYATTLPIVARIAEADARFYSVPKGRAAAHPEDLARLVSGTPCKNLHEALVRAREAVGPSGVVVVCGSVYLVGEARADLMGAPMDPPVAL
jgi:dihydrofolate synthase / folylpolyglutamate synthase